MSEKIKDILNLTGAIELFLFFAYCLPIFLHMCTFYYMYTFCINALIVYMKFHIFYTFSIFPMFLCSPHNCNCNCRVTLQCGSVT